MKRSSVVIQLVMVAGLGAAQVFAQTRPRRVEAPAADASPPQLIKPFEPENKTAEQQAPANKSRADEGDVIRIDTTLVMLPVSVSDRLGRYIPDLKKEDFHIYEEGAEQQVAYFAAVDKPFTVVLMIDTSPSDWPKLGEIRAASKVFVGQLRPDDQVMVVSFARGLTIECEATTDRQKIRKAIDKSGKGMGTHLYDAMETIMQKHLGRIKGRKAIVLFTDGVDATSKRATYQGTLREAEELDALIYPIRYDTYDPTKDNGGSSSGGTSILGILLGGGNSGAGTTRDDYLVGERYLNELARLTSGRAYESNRNLSYLQSAFSFIAEELRRQYSVGYYPKETAQAGERRHIKVRVNRPELAVRTRDSYIFKGTTDATMTPPPSNVPESSAPPVLQKKPLIQ